MKTLRLISVGALFALGACATEGEFEPADVNTDEGGGGVILEGTAEEPIPEELEQLTSPKVKQDQTQTQQQQQAPGKVEPEEPGKVDQEPGKVDQEPGKVEQQQQEPGMTGQQQQEPGKIDDQSPKHGSLSQASHTWWHNPTPGHGWGNNWTCYARFSGPLGYVTWGFYYGYGANQWIASQYALYYCQRSNPYYTAGCSVTSCAPNYSIGWWWW